MLLASRHKDDDITCINSTGDSCKLWCFSQLFGCCKGVGGVYNYSNTNYYHVCFEMCALKGLGVGMDWGECTSSGMH